MELHKKQETIEFKNNVINENTSIRKTNDSIVVEHAKLACKTPRIGENNFSCKYNV